MTRVTYREKVSRFKDGKKLVWCGWFDPRDRTYIYCERPENIDDSELYCRVCGKRGLQLYAVLRDEVSGEYYLTGSDCYRQVI